VQCCSLIIDSLSCYSLNHVATVRKPDSGGRWYFGTSDFI
jgi:hypothetical protein